MARFYGIVGYAETVETVPGVWEEQITERNYSGEVRKISKKWQAGESLNDDLVVSNEISIVADPFAFNNFHNIRYVVWMGVKWKVSRMDIQRPRITLTLGGVYNV